VPASSQRHLALATRVWQYLNCLKDFRKWNELIKLLLLQLLEKPLNITPAAELGEADWRIKTNHKPVACADRGELNFLVVLIITVHTSSPAEIRVRINPNLFRVGRNALLLLDPTPPSSQSRPPPLRKKGLCETFSCDLVICGLFNITKKLTKNKYIPLLPQAKGANKIKYIFFFKSFLWAIICAALKKLIGLRVPGLTCVR